MLLDNYQGKLLVSQPKSLGGFFDEGVVLIVKHSAKGAWGLMVNKVITSSDACLADIFHQVGMENINHVNAPLYSGGPLERQRVCVLHSADWTSDTTQEVAPGLCITTDLSILSAIAANQGPEKYRVTCGVSVWGAGQLEGEMKGEPPWTQQHRWMTVPAKPYNVFELELQGQWQQCLAQAITLEVRELF
jgi:putative transcriptional regulator